jgi:hypothetical protein
MLNKLKLAARLSIALAAIAIGVVLMSPAGRGTQASCIMPTSGTVTGLTLVNDINACNGSILSLYSGASPPGTPTTGMFWYNTSSNFIQEFDGSSWINVWYVDATNHLIASMIGGGTLTGTVTSGATTDIGSVPQSFTQVNLGTSPVTSFGASAVPGTIHVIQFNGIMTLTHNSTSLILPGGQPIVTAAGDIAFALYLGSSNWRVLNYSPASGTAVTSAAVPLGSIVMGDFMTLPPKWVYGAGQAISRSTYPGYTAAVSRAQTMTRSSGNATLTAVADTSGFGSGMPVEGAGISTGCTIASLVPNTSITLNNSTCVTANGSASITVFGTGYGAGGDSTTVGVTDCKGRVIAGRDDMLGTFAGRMTSSYFGNYAGGINLAGGNESVTETLANLIQHTHANTLSDPGHVHSYNMAAGLSPQSGSTTNVFVSNISQNTGSSVTGVTINNAAAGNASPTPMRTVQPTVIANCVVLVSP